MSRNAYTTLWSRDRLEAATLYAVPGFRFETMFGGPHTSLPSFRRAGVKAGDWIYAIHVRSGSLHVLGRMKVVNILTMDHWRRQYPHRAAELGAFDLAVNPDRPTSGPRLQLHFLAPSCTDEVVIGAEGSPIWFDRIVPPEVVETLRYASARGERPIKQVRQGKIISTAGLQGVYRLSDASERAFDAIAVKLC